MRIALGRFACSGIEAHWEGDFEAAANAALLHYTHRLKSGRAPIGLPPFCCGREGTQGAEVTFDLAVDQECQELLEREAARQETTTNQLAVHAVLIYLAELDFLAAARLG